MPVAIPSGHCLRVLCGDDEIGIVRTRFGWALVRPGEDRGMTTEIVALEEIGTDERLTTYDGTAYLRIQGKWSEL